MNRRCLGRHALVASVLLLACGDYGRAGDGPKFAFAVKPGSIQITVDGRPLATYVHDDQTITRPYFAHLHAPGAIQVTRNHPPIEGKDPTDHDTFHPGLWLAFGDLSGADCWRLKARVKHAGFVDPPKGGAGRGTFAVKNQYLAADGKKVLCTEICRYTFLARPAGFLIVWDSEFRSDDADFGFGDQEEMGLGVRVATPLIVKNGGQILTSAGHKNEKNVRGKAAPWCDFSGQIGEHRVGVTLMPDPKNFRPSWYHARDYGLLAANPFGRNALTNGEKSRVVVKKGETQRLRFGVLLHATQGTQSPDLNAAYKDLLRILDADRE